MSYTINMVFDFGSLSALTLNGQLYNADGTANGAVVTTGFINLGNGLYSRVTTIPDGHVGAFKAYKQGDASIKVGVSINPQELENADVKTSSVVQVGTGARTVTITVDDGTDPLQGARVRLYGGPGSAPDPQTTNVSGQVAFNLDDGTWTVAITRADYSFGGASLTVDGNEAATYSMTPVNITPASDPDLTNGYTVCYDEENQPEEAVNVYLQLIEGLGVAGRALDDTIRVKISNGAGLAEFPGMLRTARYQVRRGELGEWRKFNAADAPTTPIDETLGHEE